MTEKLCTTHPTRGAQKQCNRCASWLCEACATWEGAALAYCPQCPLSMHPAAPLMKRVSAAAIDFAVVVLPLFLTIWAGLFIAARSGPAPRLLSEVPLREGTDGVWLLVALLAPLAVQLGFQVMRGRSVGKWAMGLRVIDASGEPADLVQVVLLRNVAPTVLYGVCGIPALIDVVLFMSTGQRLKDRMARTRVVDDARDIPA